jgi:mannose-6-phosphate isomerase-like protein (cupin superfamily)
MSTETIQKASLDSAPVDTFGKVTMQAVSLGNAKVMRVTVNPGGGWSTDLKQHAGGDSCMHMHTGVVLSGRMAVKMSDGTEVHFSKNDVLSVPPGHDSWCIGDEPAVFLEWKTDSN